MATSMMVAKGLVKPRICDRRPRSMLAGTRICLRPVRRQGMGTALAAGAPPVVGGRADDLQPDQFADQALIFEDGLELAVVGIAPAGIGGKELAAAVDLVADRRPVVLPAAGAAEVQQLGAALVLGEDTLDMLAQCVLRGDGGRQVEAALQLQRGRDGIVEIGGIGDADGLQHALAHHGTCIGYVWMSVAPVLHHSPSVAFLLCMSIDWGSPRCQSRSEERRVG